MGDEVKPVPRWTPPLGMCGQCGMRHHPECPRGRGEGVSRCVCPALYAEDGRDKERGRVAASTHSVPLVAMQLERGEMDVVVDSVPLRVIFDVTDSSIDARVLARTLRDRDGFGRPCVAHTELRWPLTEREVAAARVAFAIVVRTVQDTAKAMGRMLFVPPYVPPIAK